MENETPEIITEEENIQEVKPKKKHKALKIILIILAVFLALIIALAAVALVFIGKLTGIGGESGTAVYSSEEFAELTNDYVSPFATEENTEEMSADIYSEDSSDFEVITLTPEESTELASDTVTDTAETATSEGTTAAQKKQETTTSSKKQETTTASKKQETTTSSKKQETTTASKKQETTTASKKQETTTSSKKQETTTSAKTQEANEYDIYRSGNFYALGWMTDSDGVTPLELAITSDSLYMLSQLEGVDIGVLIKDEKTYMLYPEKKAYMELSSVLMSMLGEDSADLFSVEELGLNDLKPLSSADSVSDVILNGVTCKKYEFTCEDGYSYVYMYGSKLMRIQQLDENKAIESTIDFSSVSATVPANKKSIPSEYDKKGMIEFMTMLTEVIG